MARSLGWMFVVGPTSALVATSVATLSHANVPALVVIIAAAMGTGAMLLSGRLDNRPMRTFEGIVAIGTVLVSAAVYFSGTPSSGFRYFYLWVIPFTWRFLTRSRALCHTAFAAACSGLVLVLQVRGQDSGMWNYAGIWIVGVTTLVMVGILVERLTASLRSADERFQQAFLDSPIGLVFLGPDLRVLEANRAFMALVGRPDDELVGSTVEVFTHPDDSGRSRDAYERALVTWSPVSFEERYCQCDGSIRTVVVDAHVQSGGAYDGRYLFCQVRDVTEERAAQHALAQHAVRDPLTGLFNRTLFLDRAERALVSNRGGSVGVLLIDVDEFKLINDALGHSEGDDVLLTLAPRIELAVRPGDTVARFGGDEFVVLVEEVADPADVIGLAERLMSVIGEPVSTAGGVFTLSASVGIAIAGHATTAEALVRDADAAMYRAKAKGRGRLEVFDETMHRAVTRRLSLENDLRNALDRGELLLHYQPIVDARTMRPHCLEALIRWQQPGRGLVSPAEFIPLAEETGQIVELGRWVLDTAVSNLARWQRLHPGDSPLRMTVNVSAVQLDTDSFAVDVARALRRHDIAPGSLAIELTESTLMTESAHAKESLAALAALGVGVLLDDFGTGYSSLSYLTKFPIDGLKLDRSFVMGLSTEQNQETIVKAVLRMATGIGLYVVAEGIESATQADRLVALGCRYMQGFGLAVPMPAEEVPAYLAAISARA